MFVAILVYLSEILYAINLLLPILSHVARDVLLKFELDTAYICQNGLKKLHWLEIVFARILCLSWYIEELCSS